MSEKMGRNKNGKKGYEHIQIKNIQQCIILAKAFFKDNIQKQQIR